jgi:Putative Actinobacterial Holin-X, holin superfamily III
VAEQPAPGIGVLARRVARHLGSLVRLERELARHELRTKSASLGAGGGVGVAVVLLAPFVVGFGLAAAAAALALVVAVWLALLIVFGALLLLVAVLALVAVRLVRRGTPLKPEQALEEARLTAQALREARGR